MTKNYKCKKEIYNSAIKKGVGWFSHPYSRILEEFIVDVGYTVGEAADTSIGRSHLGIKETSPLLNLLTR